MKDFIVMLLSAITEIVLFIVIAKYLIRYAAKVFAEEFEKRFK